MQNPLVWVAKALGLTAAGGACTGLLIFGCELWSKGVPAGETFGSALGLTMLGASMVTTILGSLVILPYATICFFRQGPQLHLIASEAAPSPQHRVASQLGQLPTPLRQILPCMGMFGCLGLLAGIADGLRPGNPTGPLGMGLGMALVLALIGIIPGSAWALFERWLERRTLAAGLNEEEASAAIHRARGRILGWTVGGFLLLGLSGLSVMYPLALVFDHHANQTEAVKDAWATGLSIGGVGGGMWGAVFGLSISLLIELRKATQFKVSGG